MRQDGQYHWYANDHLGTPQALTDSTGRVAWAGFYDSFGQCQVTVAGVDNPLRFPGQYVDPETRLHYNWLRLDDVRVGRYLQTDPARTADGSSPYSYVGNRPTVMIDPRGDVGENVYGNCCGSALHCACGEGNTPREGDPVDALCQWHDQCWIDQKCPEGGPCAECNRLMCQKLRAMPTDGLSPAQKWARLKMILVFCVWPR